jgi:hypothetical protein
MLRPLDWRYAVAQSFGVKLTQIDPESGSNFQDFELQQRRRALQHDLRQLGRLHERNLVSNGKLAKEQQRIERKLEKLGQEDAPEFAIGERQRSRQPLRKAMPAHHSEAEPTRELSIKFRLACDATLATAACRGLDDWRAPGAALLK